MERALVTGGGGFIGSNLADRLVADEIQVVIYDNFSRGQREFLSGLKGSTLVEIVEGDVLDIDHLRQAMSGCDTVFHLAANADVRFGLEDPSRDVYQNTIATFTVLEAMRSLGLTRIIFSSTGSIYGEPEIFPTPESCPFPNQTSLYGASKLAGEGLVQAYCEGFGFSGIVLRFVSILGERYTHGHLFDFYSALLADPTSLTVLGNGRQRKSYLYVGDCIEAVLLLAKRHREPGVRIYNLGLDEVSTVARSIDAVCRHLGVTPEVRYSGGSRGWIGDSPLILLDCSRVRSLGWLPSLTIDQAVERTLEWFAKNRWVFARAQTP